MSDGYVVPMVGPNGERREVSADAAAQAVQAAYEQGKEVGRVNGAARLDEANVEIRRLLAELRAAQERIERVEALIQHSEDLTGSRVPTESLRAALAGGV